MHSDPRTQPVGASNYSGLAPRTMFVHDDSTGSGPQARQSAGDTSDSDAWQHRYSLNNLAGRIEVVAFVP